MSIKLSKRICETTTYENEYSSGYVKKYSDGEAEVYGYVESQTGNDFWFISPIVFVGTYALITTNKYLDSKQISITAHYSKVENRLYFYPFVTQTGLNYQGKVGFSFCMKGRWK